MKKVFAICLLAFVLVNCGDKSDPEPAKTLNKSLLTDKYWSGVQTGFYFRSDGNFCGSTGQTVLGKWAWLNNADSLEVLVTSLPRRVWYVEYITETEMKAKLTKKGTWDIFTKK